MPERLHRRRYAMFAAISVMLSLTGTGGALLAADVYLHRKYERTSLFNVWGYRGPARGAKLPGEFRIAVLGGSAAFGFGVAADEAMPHFLEQRLNAAGTGEGSGLGATSFSVVNLAFNSESAASFRPTLEDFRSLDYDMAILYEGYNDLLARPKTNGFRRGSIVFRMTGYMPVLPLVAREKYFEWRYRGDISQGYRDRDAAQTVFRPGDARAAAQAAESLAARLGTLSATSEVAAADCSGPWLTYCLNVIDGVQAARAAKAMVLVASQPYISDLHVQQQAALRGAITGAFAHDPGVRFASFGRSIDLHDTALAFDGMHLTAEGNLRLALAMAPEVVALVNASMAK